VTVDWPVIVALVVLVALFGAAVVAVVVTGAPLTWDGLTL
jgi:hypothetical protein